MEVARATTKAVLWGIAYLPLFLMALLLVTDVTVIGQHFYGDKPLAVGSLLDDLWPGPILKATVILAIFAVAHSTWFHGVLGSLPLRGSTFILVFFLILLLGSLAIVDHYDIYYPAVFEGDRVITAMKFGLTILSVPFAAVLMNDSLAKPAPTALIVGLWLALFVVVKIWSVYVFTGELDLTSPITMWFKK